MVSASPGLEFRSNRHVSQIKIIANTSQDPMIKQRVIKLAVEFSTRALDRKPSFALKVLEHILMVRPAEMPNFPAYTEAVKELQSICSHELQRLAMRYPDYFAVSFRPSLLLLPLLEL